MAVTYTKDSTSRLFKSQAIRKITDMRNMLLDPSDGRKTGVKAGAYGVLFGALVDSAEYLSDSSNRQFVVDYWKKKFGVMEDDQPVVHVGTPSPSASAGAGVNAPAVNQIVNDLITQQNKVTDGYNKLVEGYNQRMVDISASRTDFNQTLANQYAGNSALLNHQLYLKNSLDEINNALDEQTGVLASMVGILDIHLGALAQFSGLSYATKMKEVDAKIYETASNDYGDDNYFFSFEPTHEYWSKVDIATIEYYKELGWNVPSPLPSAMGAMGELAIIDNYQLEETKSQVRGRIEDYRKREVPSHIRARLGVSLVNAKTKELEGSKAQADYYTQAVEGSRLADGSIAREYGDTASRATAEALATVAKWAETAKVKDEFLTTPRTARDINGETVKEGVTPLEVTLAKDVALAKGEADTNSIGATTLNTIEELFDDMSIDDNFFKRYVRIDEMLQFAKNNPDGGSDGWEGMMQGLYS